MCVNCLSNLLALVDEIKLYASFSQSITNTFQNANEFEFFQFGVYNDHQQIKLTPEFPEAPIAYIANRSLWKLKN